jgi:hypothetical protein
MRVRLLLIWSYVLYEGHFINNAHYFFTCTYISFWEVSLYNPVLSPCFSLTAFQRCGRFAVPFRVQLLFSPRMARITAAETSSREGKRCPRMGSF